jgi:hypothetical protein
MEVIMATIRNIGGLRSMRIKYGGGTIFIASAEPAALRVNERRDVWSPRYIRAVLLRHLLLPRKHAIQFAQRDIADSKHQADQSLYEMSAIAVKRDSGQITSDGMGDIE